MLTIALVPPQPLKKKSVIIKLDVCLYGSNYNLRTAKSNKLKFLRNFELFLKFVTSLGGLETMLPSIITNEWNTFNFLMCISTNIYIKVQVVFIIHTNESVLMYILQEIQYNT